jgi:Holliday junction DNA helicase RuvA
MTLYGFLSADDLALYEMLLKVSGIGPKGAIGILSVMDADDLRFAVLSGDAALIAKAPGIGRKTAQKVILELKDKLDLGEAFEKKSAHQADLKAAKVRSGRSGSPDRAWVFRNGSFARGQASCRHAAGRRGRGADQTLIERIVLRSFNHA